jgi:hypothetical protein
MISTRLPPPRLVTEMLLSVRASMVRVPTCVGRMTIAGGSLEVNLGSQRMACGVVSF